MSVLIAEPDMSGRDLFPCSKTDGGKRNGSPDTDTPPKSGRAIPRGIALTPADWDYIQQWDGDSLSQKVAEIILYARKFAPNGPDAGKPRDPKTGRWKKSG